jgi:protein TonB
MGEMLSESSYIDVIDMRGGLPEHTFMRRTRFLVLPALVALAAFAVAQDNPAQKHLRVSSGVAEGLIKHKVSPKYPREAREQGIQGDVLLQGTIDTNGNLVDLKVLQGDPILVKAAVDAVKKWKYRPFILKGEPVDVDTTIKIEFHL